MDSIEVDVDLVTITHKGVTYIRTVAEIARAIRDYDKIMDENDDMKRRLKKYALRIAELMGIESKDLDC